MTPKLTIIMSTYNDAKYLSKALESILEQTYTDWKLILINDCSEDDTEKIIHKYFKNDKRLDYVKNKERQGITTNIKMAIKRADSTFIARLDSDDYWINKRKLSIQIDKLSAHPQIGLLGTWANVVNPDGAELYSIQYPTDDKNIRNKILRENCFVTSSIMFRKPSDSEVNQIRPANRYADDYNLNLQLGITGEFANLPDFCTAYRINPLGISQSKQTDQITDTLKVISYYKQYYSGFYISYALWTLRKYYPSWIRGKNSMKLKDALKYY